MTGKKISESIKNEIIDLYKHTGETTSTLAERYGVSNSTISRMLKITLPEQEYEVLIASKRAARVPGTDTVKQLTNLREIEPSLVAAQPQTELKLEQLEEKTATPTPTPTIKRRSISSQPEIPVAIDDSTRQNRPPIETDDYPEPSAKGDLNTLIIPSNESNFAPPISKVIASSEQPATNNLSFPTEEETSAIVAEMLAEEMLEEAEDSEGLDDEDLDYSDDDEDLEEPTKIVKRPSASNVLIQVLPLSEANLPKTCYLVIDRLSELITRPLKEFGDLGQIPAQETNQKTLPVFDNHRVARRFSTKRDRVIKVPDSKMLQKACPHLHAKGITRLLVDGQVYSLYPS